MQRLSSRVWPSGWHPGGLGWWLGRQDDPGAEVIVCRSNGDVSGWASIADEHDATLDADPADADATRELAGWLGAKGYTEQVPRVGLFRDAAGASPDLPDGYVVRHVRPGEFEARVEVHRAAWRPADLPYPPEHRPDFAPGATSNVTAATYERVRQTWLYDETFDLVAVAPDGSLAACCIGWFDPATGATEIEPLGVVPGHRRLGLAGALCHEVCARTAARGGTRVFINVNPNERYPAPPAAYLKAGFRAEAAGVLYRRPKASGTI